MPATSGGHVQEIVIEFAVTLPDVGLRPAAVCRKYLKWRFQHRRRIEKALINAISG